MSGTFTDLGLAPEVLRAVADAGYTSPTPIQQQAIPLILSGRDLVGTAQTGTGKTAGFTLPMIQILAAGRARARMPRSLILEPTRELAAQVAENFDVYGRYHKLNKALLIGGVAYGNQETALKRGADVLIATPGRLLDHVERGMLLLADIKIVVIDEADRMLDMGFIPDIERIFKLLPKRRQTLMFSATMPKEIRRLADTYLADPMSIAMASPDKPAETVDQALVRVPDEPAAKRDALRRLLRGEPIKNAIIFCNRKRDVATLARSLIRHGFNAAALHGDMNQADRQKTLDRFKDGQIALLVASDVAARGLDISEMSHVFNFDVPNHAEDYIHRIGRTGRAGRSGRAITLASPVDHKRLAAVESLIGKRIPAKAGEIAPAEAAPEAAEAAVTPSASAEERKPRRRARGGRARSGRKADRPLPQERPEAQTAAQPVARPEAQPERRHEEPPAPRRKEETRRAPRDRHREGRRHESDRSERVVGMGDHVPAFLLRLPR